MSFCFTALRSSTLFNQIILERVEREGYCDLSPALLSIFAHLAEAEPMSVSTLANALGSSRQAVHKSVGKLVASGYVTLQARPKNRKEKIIVLTGRGEALIKLALEVINETQEQMAAFLGRDAFGTFMTNQEKLLEFLERLSSETSSTRMRTNE
jgi:DNA-binding MarR family transcriptional regulator